MVSNKKVGEYRPPLKILVTGIDFYGLFYENEVLKYPGNIYFWTKFVALFLLLMSRKTNWTPEDRNIFSTHDETEVL